VQIGEIEHPSPPKLRPADEELPAWGEQPVRGVAPGEAAPCHGRRRLAGGGLLLLDLLQHPHEGVGVARQRERARGRVPERLLGLLQQRPEQRVVDALGPDREPLPPRADAHRAAALRRRRLLLAPPRAPAPVQRLRDEPRLPPFLQSRRGQLLLDHGGHVTAR
jgi:hypothetical protein